MHALSYGVVRVDQDNSLTSLTIQDVGHVLPGAIIGVVKIDGPPALCQTDEIGEVVMSAKATASGYWALPGLSTNTFKVIPLGSDERPIGTQEFVRSGLLGFLGPVSEGRAVFENLPSTLFSRADFCLSPEVEKD